MKEKIYSFDKAFLDDGFYWFNEPEKFKLGQGLEIWTEPNTDFWQRTHYGFRNDNGHALLRDVSGDFSLTVEVEFRPQGTYDQCGLFLRIDTDNWIKASVEFLGDESRSKLGSVVTNLGYSDWATQDISPSIQHLWYQASRRGPDVKLAVSFDGKLWQQMRICHLHYPADRLAAGVYACSPTNSRFWCRFAWLKVGPNVWEKE